MALSATLPRIRPSSSSSSAPARARLVAAFRLGRMSVLVLRGRVPVDLARSVLDRHHPDRACPDCARRGARPARPTGDGVPVPAVASGSSAAVQATSTTLVLAGLISLLGVAGAVTFVVQSATAPVRPAVRVRSVVPGVLVCSSVVVEDPVEIAATPSGPAAPPVATTRYVAARSRAVGPTSPLWHAVPVDRLAGAGAGACETTVCGALVRLTAEQVWPVVARGVCPACAAVAG